MRMRGSVVHYIHFAAIFLYAASRFLLKHLDICCRFITATALQHGHFIFIIPSEAAPQSNSLLLEQFGH